MAATTALAPGIGSTVNPASRMAATRAAPGSEIPGVPASVTRATDSPFASRASDSFDTCALVVLVDAEDRGFDIEMAKQNAGSTRIFGSDELDLLEHLDGTEGDVVEIADGRRDDVEHAFRSRGPSGHSKLPLRDGSPSFLNLRKACTRLNLYPTS